MHHAFLLPVLLCLCQVLTSFGQPAESAASRADLNRQFAADRDSVRAFYNTQVSTHAFAAHEKLLDRWKAIQRRVKAKDFRHLDRAAQVDWLLMENLLAAQSASLTQADKDLAEDLLFLGFADEILNLHRTRLRVEEFEEAETAQVLESIPKLIQEARKEIERRNKKKEERNEEKKQEADTSEALQKKGEPGLKKDQAVRISRRAQTLQRYLEQWYKHYADFRPGFDWWMKQPFEQAKKSIEEYHKWLREKIAGVNDSPSSPLLGVPIGRKRLIEELRYEFIPYSPEDVLAMGEQEFAWCEKQGQKACRELGFDTWQAGLEQVKSLHVAPGEQAALVAAYAHEAAKFVTDLDLLTVPPLCLDSWTVEMVDAKQQRTMPYALYGGNRVRVAFAASGHSHEQKEMSMRGNNLHATRLVTAHEVIPGHHLQTFFGKRHRPDRGLYRTPFFIEGWCLYWETRLWDLDFARGPEDQIGMLFWRMHRCARIIVTLKFHLGQITPDEMVNFLVARVGHERAQATAEVRRYIAGNYGALYQAAYMVGGLQMRALHKELVQDAGWTEKRFHDAVLRLGPIPVEMMRAELNPDVKLHQDYKTNWRFYD